MMKKLLVPALLGFGVTLAVVIGQRMSTDAMAVVIGVAVGVAASVPTSVLLVALLRRERNGWSQSAGWRSELPQQSQPAYPQFATPNVIILNPADLLAGRGLQQPQIPALPLPLAQDAGLHRLRVVGDEDGWNP
jgi:hypothetical protein